MRAGFFPKPENHTEWRSWAEELVRYFRKPEENLPINLAAYPLAKLPPANRDGMLIFSEGAVYASVGGEWKQLAFEP